MPKPTIKQLKPWLVVLSAATYFFFVFININVFNTLNDAMRDNFQLNALQFSNLSAMFFMPIPHF